jgi:hypothetical protein
LEGLLVADRRAQTIQLLGSLYNEFPGPKPNLRTPAGLAPGRLEPCADCNGTGNTRDRYSRLTACTRCQGRGKLAYDTMDSLHTPVGSHETLPTARPRNTVKCDACEGEGAHGNGRRCRHCNGEGRVNEHVFELVINDDEPEPADVFDRWEKALDRRNTAGSYRELDRALADLSRRSYLERRLVEVVYVTAAKTPDELSTRARERLEVALNYLVNRMPDRIVVPREVARNAEIVAERRTRAKGRGSHPKALEQRAVEMRRHARDGRSPQWIAAEYGVSVRVVYEVVNERRTA